MHCFGHLPKKSKATKHRKYIKKRKKVWIALYGLPHPVKHNYSPITYL